MTTDESGFIEDMYHEMYDLLISYALSSLNNHSQAEDAVQETFRIACLKSKDLYDSPNPQGWLIKTVKNVVRNMKRSYVHADELLRRSRANEGEAYSEDKLNLEVTYENIAHLDEFQLIREMAVEGRSHLEMAKKRGISVEACKKRVERAKKRLKRLM